MFLGLHIGIHDTNISLYNNGKAHYCKAERNTGKKHGVGDMKWLIETLNKMGVDNPEEDIEEVVCCTSHIKDRQWINANNSYMNGQIVSEDTTFFGGSADDSKNKHNIFSEEILTPLLNSSYHIIRKIKTEWRAELTELDHHTIHTYSTFRDNQQAVLDGKGTGNKHGLLNDKVLTIGMPSWPFGSFLTRVGLRMELGTGHEINDSLDLPGKIMGLQAYGKVSYKFSDMRDIQLLNYAFAYKGEPTFENKEWLDFVATMHNTLEEDTLKLFEENYDKSKPISYTGGVALNVVNNSNLAKHFDLKVPPHCGDEGISIGALNWLAKKHGFEITFDNYPFIQEDELPWDEVCTSTIKSTAEALARGKIVGWYQGHGEVGPRALGNRSILMDPTIKNGKQKINEVKKREPWRPFGASVKEDQAHRFFDMPKSRYMLFNSKVKYSGIPAVTHIDGTCRHNTVTPEMNPAYYELLDHFERLTGVPVLLNTSLNRMGESICGTRDQAIQLFNESTLDQLVLGSKTWRK